MGGKERGTIFLSVFYDSYYYRYHRERAREIERVSKRE